MENESVATASAWTPDNIASLITMGNGIALQWYDATRPYNQTPGMMSVTTPLGSARASSSGLLGFALVAVLLYVLIAD